MLGGFLAFIMAGHIYIVFMTIVLIFRVWYELIQLKYKAHRETDLPYT